MAKKFQELEMQVQATPVEKRSRYYHSQMDVELLMAGSDYEKLPNSYVIFICDYPLFPDSQKPPKYKYTIRSSCDEDPSLGYIDGTYTILLSTRGNNPEKITPKLLAFLEYVKQPNSELKPVDSYAARLDETITKIKRNREMGVRYMMYEEMMKKEPDAGFAEGEARQAILTQQERERADKAEAALAQYKAMYEELALRLNSSEKNSR